MADIKLRIELNPNASEESLGNITNYDEIEATNDNLSNTSLKADENGVFQNISKATGNGSNGLTWAYGELKFDSEGYLDNIEESGAYLESEQNPTQFFWGAVPEDTKYYYVRLEFTNAKSLKELTILGDKLTNQFPTRAILDGTLEVFSDDAEWNIEFPTESDTHTIEFTHWNRGNYNATITKIAILGQYLYVDKANGLKSVETLTQSSSSPSDIFYGVVPNSGSAELLDSNGELHDMIVDGVISDSKVKVDVLANGNVVGSHYTEDTNYDNYSKIVSFDMGDGLANWDSLIYGGYDLVEGSRTAYQMLLSVFESLGYNSTQVDKMLETEIIYGNDNVIGSVKSYLEQIVIQYPYLLSDTYRNTINKFCTLAQLQLLQMDNGDLKFVSARPIATNDELENTIQINAKDQFSTLDRTAIVKNKINTVEIETSITLKKAKEVFSEGDDGISVSQMGREETVILKEVHHDNGVFYLKGDKFRYRVSFNMNNISEIFIKNIEEFKIKLTREKRNKQNLYKDGWFNSAVNTTESESSESFYPNIVSKYQNGDILNFEIEVIMGTYDSGDFIDGYTWSTYTTTSKSFVVEVDCIEKNNQNTLYGLGLAQNKTSIQGNELLQNVTMYKNEKISSIISENILKDYSDGIADGSITVSCADYYNKNGEKTKEWASGQIIEVGDIIVPKKDNLGTSLVNYRNGNEYKWRVKSATFRKGGIPFLDLQVQEIRQP
ncbi:MAG: hypothetical protein IJ371_01915 [Clostridia bacterium]|nr:hypothetical protein [Clostridia bacterium]